MGYFSRLDVSLQEETFLDNSYPSHKDQLLWRYEDLNYRLSDLSTCDCTGCDFLASREDLLYALPEDLCRASDVRKAIELVLDELEIAYGTIPELPSVEARKSQTYYEQISIFACGMYRHQIAA